MASQRMEDIFAVSRELKAQILARLDAGEEVLIDDVDKIVRDACAKVAANMRKEPETVYDACTRRIHFHADELYNSVKEIIEGKGQTLVDHMYKYKVEKEDTDYIIRKRMSEIFNRDFTMPNPYSF